LRSKQKGLPCSNRVGHHFTGNGDFLAFGYNNDVPANSIGLGSRTPPFDNPAGTNITSIIDLRSPTDSTPDMVIEEGVVPGALAKAFNALVSVAAGLEGKDTDRSFADWLRETSRKITTFFRGPYHGAANHTMTYLAMTRDDDNGTMLLQGDRLRIEWPNVGNQPVFEKVSKTLFSLTKALGGTYTKNPVWTKLFSRQLITVHPLGGCIMGENIEEAVVNHKGQVFSGTDQTAVYDGLYVNDGAIIPSPLCINPSLTISALAERNCKYMAKDRGWTFNYEFPLSKKLP
jgi:cholesterol oxidase